LGAFIVSSTMDLQPQTLSVWRGWHFRDDLSRMSTVVQDRCQASVVFLDKSQGKSR